MKNQTEKSQSEGPIVFSHTFIQSFFFGNNEHKKYLNRFDAVATFALTYSFTFIGNGLRFVCFGSFRWFYWYQAI